MCSSIWPFVSEGVSIEECIATPFVTAARDGQAYYEYPWKLIAHSSDDLRLYRLDQISDQYDPHGLFRGWMGRID
jgi:hypothetical protein